MSKKKYPKSEQDRVANLTGPAYISWDTDDVAERSKAFSLYTQALEEASYSIANIRDYRGLTDNIDGRPGLRGSDFDWFRPNQRAPLKPKEIIAFARFAYRRIGLIHNAIDLMGDFTCQGIRLAHPNRRIEKFYQAWFKEVQGRKVSERISNLLFREANVPIRYYTAKVNKKKRLEMQKSVGAADIDYNADDPVYSKNEIPWRYVFIDPLLVEPLGGSLSTLSRRKILKLKIPYAVKEEIKRLQFSSDSIAREILNKIAPDILKAVNLNQDLILPPDKTYILHYKKDDWQVWADPMTYSAFDDLNLYHRLKLADKAALDGAISKIRVWKIGSLEYKLAPSPVASATLADMLGANVGGGTIDIVWGPDIELIETSSDVESFLGEEKYKPTLMAIYASLGIPPTLTGTFGASGTTNNFIALKTLVERLNYVRNILIEFWNEQIELVQKAMGFRMPAQVEFDIMYLDDPAAIINLLLDMVDRNILSDEFVQRHIKASPELERKRIQSESKARESKNMEKISPYHQVDKEYGLKKTALQTGVVTPSEIGLKLDKKKKGEKSMLDVKDKQTNKKPPAVDMKNPGLPGRPKNTKDTKPRKEKVFKPKNKAAIELWAKGAQEKIADIINPIILNSYSKSSIRSLTSSEFNELERIKFEILCNLDMGAEITKETVALASRNTDITIHDEFNGWLSDAQSSIGKKLTIDQIRDLQAIYYVYYKYGI